MQLSELKKIFGLRLDECQTMDELRVEIDTLDQKIVDMLTIRRGYMDQAARIKQDRNKVRDNERVEEVVRKVSSYAMEKGTDPELVAKIYRMMIEWSINYEMDKFDKLKNK